MRYSVVKTLIVLTTLLVVTLVASNLAALKIWALSSIPVDAGIILFPISYLITDMLVYIYGERTADLVTWCTAIFTVMMTGIFYLANFLPNYPNADNTAFLVVRSATGRIFIASCISFLVSQLVNNHVFVKIGKDRYATYRIQSLVSSMPARAIDVSLFEILAFFGNLTFAEFAKQAIFAYLAGLAIEAILSLASCPLAKLLRERLHYCNGRNC